MRRKQRRMIMIGTIGAVLVAATALVLTAIGDTVSYFYGPSEIAAGDAPPERSIRLGGLVEFGSVKRFENGTVHFNVTDEVSSVTVAYAGILPDLFREGQGIVVQGRLDDGRMLKADQVLAKHDENYMPSEVAEAMKRAGTWRGEEAHLGAPEGGAAEEAKPTGY
jgi:cytochrome c-type biogenesis protein CcmE